MSKTGKVTLSELMGSRGEEFHKSGIELSDLPSLLGDSMPKVEYHALGRIRLIRALRNRFGSNYRSLPGVQQVLSKFDGAVAVELKHHEIKKRLGRK